MELISLLIISFYILYIIINYGIPHSLSASYYLIKHKWIFSTVLAVSSMMILPIMLSKPYAFLYFFGICGILFVSVSPNFKKDNFTDLVHTWSAIISLIVSLLWVALLLPIVLCCWIPFLIYMCILFKNYYSITQILDKSNIKFYAELIMLLTVYCTIFY